MSTVPETIAANHMGMKVLGISCVTNFAAGVTDQKLDHKEVLEVGERVKGTMIDLLRRVLPRLQINRLWIPLFPPHWHARENAHAPFSKFKVGAAVEDVEREHSYRLQY